MSFAISAIFISDFEQFFICKEKSYVKVSQFLQMLKVHVTDYLPFLEIRRNNH